MSELSIRSKIRDLKCFEIGGGKVVMHTKLSNGLKYNRIQILGEHLSCESVFRVSKIVMIHCSGHGSLDNFLYSFDVFDLNGINNSMISQRKNFFQIRLISKSKRYKYT